MAESVDWIPIIMFIGITVVLCVLIWFRYRTRSEVQQTIRSALDKGQELSPELIERLVHPKQSKDKDMRLGVMWLAAAAGVSALGFVIPDGEDVARVFLGIAAFPLAIGIAYMILYKFTDRE